jgi:hypothetical protein
MRGLLVVALVFVHGDRAARAQEAPRTQVSDLKGEFRAGQTFLTWREVAGEGVSYKIYRKAEPFQGAHPLVGANCIGEAGASSSLNVMASIDRLALSQTKPGELYEIPERVYFIIKEGEAPLPDNSGLFVYTAKRREGAYYAVTAVIDGVEQTGVTAGGNTLSEPVREEVEFPQPVKQNETDHVHWVDDVGTEFYPAMGNRPGVAYNFRLKVPPGAGPFPLHGLLHGGFFQYNTPDQRRGEKLDGPGMAGCIRVALDAPVIRGQVKGLDLRETPPGGWYGFDGQDYHARRVLWTLQWIGRRFPLDPAKVYVEGGSMGGIGALMLGLLYPDRFAAIKASIPPLIMPKGMTAFGPSPVDYVRDHPGVEFPYIVIVAGRTDSVVGWPDKLDFARAAEQSRVGYTFVWHPFGHGGASAGLRANDPRLAGRRPIPLPDLNRFARDQSFPALARCSVNHDPGTVNLAVRPDQRPPLDAPRVGDLDGTFNGAIDWERETIVDTPENYAITLRLLAFAGKAVATADVTPRRLQRFKPVAGRSYRYEVQDSQGEILGRGTVAADRHGHVTVPQVKITPEGTRLAISPA